MVCVSLLQAVTLSDTMMVNRYVKWQFVNKKFQTDKESEQEPKWTHYCHIAKSRHPPPRSAARLYVPVLRTLPGFPGFLVNAVRLRSFPKPKAVSSHALCYIKHTQAVLVPIQFALLPVRHSVYR
jgi:hypothetical protein